jgi:hypothetical protein
MHFNKIRKKAETIIGLFSLLTGSRKVVYCKTDTFFFFFFLGATVRGGLWPPLFLEGFVTMIVLQGGVVNPTPNPQLFWRTSVFYQGCFP